jgi:hypothetical protein
MGQPLKELREEWEDGLKVIHEFTGNDRLLVVLMGCAGFSCHRYFVIGNEGDWEISVDVDRGRLENVLQWIASPRSFNIKKLPTPMWRLGTHDSLDKRYKIENPDHAIRLFVDHDDVDHEVSDVYAEAMVQVLRGCWHLVEAEVKAKTDAIYAKREEAENDEEE